MASRFSLFVRRLIAMIIDLVISCIFSHIISMALIGGYRLINNIKSDDDSMDYSFLITVVGFVFFYFVYYPLCEWKGKRLGKNIMNIKTVSLKTGEQITLKQAYLRGVLLSSLWILLFIIIVLGVVSKVNITSNFWAYGSIISVVVLVQLISYLSIFWTKNKQAWHDYFSNVIVVEK